MSFITNQWVKMNPAEAATLLLELERENAALRAESKLLRAAQKISEETDGPIIRDILSLRAKVDELEHENAEELRRVRADKTEVLGKLAQVERENEKLRQALDAQMQYQRDLRADRDRLDLLASRYWAVPVTKEYTDHIWMIDHDTPDLRAAIDARAKEGGAT